MEHRAFTFNNLLDVLQDDSPQQIAMLRTTYKDVRHGLLSVGIKLHVLEECPGISDFLLKLRSDHYGGGSRPYMHEKGLHCIVLPPVGSADTAVRLLECIERTSKTAIFNNPAIQIQVCTPGRLDPQRAAILSVVFYLGSDVLRRYELDDLATTFSNHATWTNLRRGRRFTIWDGEGALDTDFEYWWYENSRLKVLTDLPFTKERTDVIVCQTKVDVQNVNLVASLMVHDRFMGYWGRLGSKLASEVEQLLGTHLLRGVLDVPWIRTDEEATVDDEAFFSTFTELMVYAFDESARIRRRRLVHFWQQQPESILISMREIIERYRRKVIQEARTIEGGRT